MIDYKTPAYIMPELHYELDGLCHCPKCPMEEIKKGIHVLCNGKITERGNKKK